MKIVATAALAALALGAVTAPAYAHSYLIESYPAKKQEVRKPLHHVRLLFSGKADAFSIIELKNAKGAVVAKVTQKEAAQEIVLRTPILETGAYQIHYRILSADGDVVDGSVDFSVTGVEA